MTPGWENVRLGLANSYHPKPRFELPRSRQFWLILALAAALWALIGAVVFG